jgi:hypothetical protein
MSLAPVAKFYLSRRVSYVGTDGIRHVVREDELDPRERPIVILGEPGTGKTDLLRNLGRKWSAPFITAAALIRRDRLPVIPGAGVPLLIDALDEAAARVEGDAVDRVLNKLDILAFPDFILSCRAADWEARTRTAITEDYNREPLVCTLEPLSRDEAIALLAHIRGNAEPADILDALDRQQLGDLAGNPFMLTLLGRVSSSHGIPSSRARLFEQAASLMWREHNDEHAGGRLDALSESTALDAAGAAFAALLLSGNEALVRRSNPMGEGKLAIAEVARLPGAADADAILSSKLVRSDGAGGFIPIHRVMAEFLGARWLAGHVSGRRARGRLLAALGDTHVIPARLRGLHAWLAFHSPSLAPLVMARDPYGVIRYGDNEELNGPAAGQLLDALEALAQADPWFRAEDWGRHPIAGLMRPELAGRLDGLIVDPETSPHLRSLLLEGMVGSAIVPALPSLEAILFDRNRFVSERLSVMRALAPHRAPDWRLDAVERLLALADEPSGDIALSLLEAHGDHDIPADLILRALLAVAGLLTCRLPRLTGNRAHMIRDYDGLIASMPPERLARLLDAALSYEGILKEGQRSAGETDVFHVLGQAILHLLATAPDIVDVPRLWPWLALVREADLYRRNTRKDLVAAVGKGDLRRAIQAHVYIDLAANEAAKHHSYSLWRFGLSPDEDEVAALLTDLSAKPAADPALRETWRALLRSVRPRTGLPQKFAELGRRFARDDAALLAELEVLCAPLDEQPWEIEERLDREKRAAGQAVNRAARIADLHTKREGMRAGDVRYITRPATAYLGHFSDIEGDDPLARLIVYAGDELAQDALAGFAAALWRNDLPDLATAKASRAEGRTWNIVYALAAGLLADLDRGIDLSGTPEHVAQLVLLFASSIERGNSNSDGRRLIEALQASIYRDPAQYEAALRLQIEPQLERGKEHASGLYGLTHAPVHPEVALKLADDWLTRFPGMSAHDTAELIDGVIALGKAKPLLRTQAISRRAPAFATDEKTLMWRALDWLFDFAEVEAGTVEVAREQPTFLFHVNVRLGDRHRGETIDLSPVQAEWLIREFRSVWRCVDIFGEEDGRQAGNAADCLRRYIDGLASDVTPEAVEVLSRLTSAPEDSWTTSLRHALAEQRQKIAERTFQPIAPAMLEKLLADGPPGNIEDLRALVLEELSDLQLRLRGSDTDTVSMFWQTDEKPWDENRCRDRLADLLASYLDRYGVQQIPERDMPADKRADLAFSIGNLQLPLEAKGQWHDAVWDAASGQLDRQYLRDWRSNDRGIYIVFWFGKVASSTRRRLKSPPAGVAVPESPEAMRKTIIGRVPPDRRSAIEVVVLDLTNPAKTKGAVGPAE